MLNAHSPTVTSRVYFYGSIILTRSMAFVQHILFTYRIYMFTAMQGNVAAFGALPDCDMIFRSKGLQV